MIDDVPLEPTANEKLAWAAWRSHVADVDDNQILRLVSRTLRLRRLRKLGAPILIVDKEIELVQTAIDDIVAVFPEQPKWEDGE